jgi:hypothetical protein
VHTKDYIGNKFCSSKLKFAARNIFNLHLRPRTTRASPTAMQGLYKHPPGWIVQETFSKETLQDYPRKLEGTFAAFVAKQ